MVEVEILEFGLIIHGPPKIRPARMIPGGLYIIGEGSVLGHLHLQSPNRVKERWLIRCHCPIGSIVEYGPLSECISATMFEHSSDVEGISVLDAIQMLDVSFVPGK